MSKKSYIFCFVILILLFLLSYFVGVMVGDGESDNMNTISNNKELVKKENNIQYNGYWIKTKNNYIVIFNSEMELLSNTEISVDLFSENDKKILENGIYVETAEDLFRYLESYTS